MACPRTAEEVYCSGKLGSTLSLSPLSLSVLHACCLLACLLASSSPPTHRRPPPGAVHAAMPRSLLRIPLSPASLLAVSCLISFSSAQTCYVAQDGGVQRASTWKACPGSASDGFEICCLPGSECGEDMLCHIPSSFGPGPNSWYQAGCTDPTYQSSVCRKDCGE